MVELRVFFERLIQGTKIAGTQPTITIEDDPSLQVKIDYSSPSNERPSRRSAILIFGFADEFISDHPNNLTDSIPINPVIEAINGFDFENYAKSSLQIRPSKLFIITNNGLV